MRHLVFGLSNESFYFDVYDVFISVTLSMISSDIAIHLTWSIGEESVEEGFWWILSKFEETRN